MGQMHELLAVESSLRSKANNTLNETIDTFVRKSEHFDGLIKVYESFTEDGSKISPDKKEISVTVGQSLQRVQAAIVGGINAQVSKEETNCSGEAKADLKVGGTVFGKFSATTLLALESQLLSIKLLYKAIPVLDPTKSWSESKTKGPGIYIADSEIKYRTEKTMTPLELAPPTKEHKAQVEVVTVDTQVGQYLTTYYSGKLTSGQKNELLGRIDCLINAVKRARSKANQVDVKDTKIGRELFTFIDGDTLNN